ncbi:MAG: amino acid permease [Candidatus Aenigmarchaeota archaeon]|nr:amino acid permease [Candidatus Aenigmarchaeota archaeon]
MKRKHKTYKLKKSLGLLETTFYGVGIILGAGIYAILGHGAGVAQGGLWISFIIAAIIGSFTGLTYAELASRYPKDAAEFNYTKKAFNRKYLAFIVAWIMIFVGIVSAATVSLGFAGYFAVLFGTPVVLVAVALILLLSLLSWIGIKESAKFNILSTLIEMGGLVIVVLIGISIAGSDGISTDVLKMPETGFAGILAAVGLIFFAYIGFEDMANMAEEVKNPKKTIPKALVISITITTILYILVSIFAVSSVGWETLSKSDAPLTTIAEKGLGQNGIVLMSVIALFATANTVLIILIVVSRILYGLSCQGVLSKTCKVVGKRGTPHFSILLVCIVTIGFALIGNIKTVASLTDVGIFIVYIAINISLIKIRLSEKKASKKHFRSPVNIGRFPLLALFGLLSAGFMLFYFEPLFLAGAITIIAVGFCVYKVFNR